jgi:lipopolysaccharide export system protein LptA
MPFANAAKADDEQEIFIDADRQTADLKNKMASYIDDVKITQGSLTINADLVHVFSPKNKQKTYLAKGKPATFEQILEDGSLVTLQADEIRYEPAIHTIIISGHALLRQEGSEVSGSKITYNTLTKTLEAESNKNGSVTTILQPKKSNVNAPENDDKNKGKQP